MKSTRQNNSSYIPPSQGCVPLQLISTFFGRCFEFFIGIYLALLYRSGAAPAIFRKLKGWLTAIGAAGIVLIIIALMNIGAALHVNYGINTVQGAVVNNFVLPPAIGLFMYGLLTESSLLRKLLETKAFQLLGKSSYAFYLIHAGFIQFFLRKYVTDVTAITFFILTALSIIIYKFAEEPLNKRLRRQV